MPTKTQFTQALQSSSEAGFPIVLNVMTCCRGCTTEEDVQKAYDSQAKEFDLPAVTFEKDAPNAVWHFGGQGNRITFPHFGDAQAIEDDECDCYEEEDEYDEDDEGNETLVREGEFIECSVCKNGPREVALTSLMLNHPSDEAAQAAVKALSEAGISADWDGSRAECITVH